MLVLISLIIIYFSSIVSLVVIYTEKNISSNNIWSWIILFTPICNTLLVIFYGRSVFNIDFSLKNFK